jgi:hypothetical protein
MDVGLYKRLRMNIWKEPYPSQIIDVVNKSNNLLNVLEAHLNESNCKKLNQLYITIPMNRIQRKKTVFNEMGYLPNTKLSPDSKFEDELRALYVFGEYLEEFNKTVPKYIGISRTVFRKLKQYGWGEIHNEATLASLKVIQKGKHYGARKEISQQTIEKQQHIIRNYKVAILPEKLDFDMYFMEVYFAGIWKTEWNTFKTH